MKLILITSVCRSLDLSNTLEGIKDTDIQVPAIKTYFSYFEEHGLLETILNGTKDKTT